MIPPYEERGAGKPVVLLHAFPFSRTMWSRNIEALTSAGARVIMPDLRGFGEYESFADINLMDDMAGDVIELLDRLKIGRAAIGGLSMGGYTTFALFRKIPEKFAAILLFDTTSASDTEEKRQNRFSLIDKINKDGSQALVENMLPSLTGDFTKENNPGLVKDLEQRVVKTNPRAAIAALRGMADRPDSTDIISQIDVPACLVFGREDKVTNLDAAEMMKNNLKNAELTIIENAGHLSNLEQPEQFNAAVSHFIRNIKI
jgi:pimeloyl-ACP methyl ester carboxylesterase